MGFFFKKKKASLGVFNPNSPIFLHPRASSIPGELGKAPQPPLKIRKCLFLSRHLLHPAAQLPGRCKSSSSTRSVRADVLPKGQRNGNFLTAPWLFGTILSRSAGCRHLLLQKLAARCGAAEGLQLPFLPKLPGVCSLSTPPICSLAHPVPFISCCLRVPWSLSSLSRVGLCTAPTSAGLSLSALATHTA